MNRRITFVGATLLATFAAAPIQAATTPLLNPKDARVCSKDDATVTSADLLRALLRKRPISDEYRDVDGNGTLTATETYLAILTSDEAARNDVYAKRNPEDKTSVSNAQNIAGYFVGPGSNDIMHEIAAGGFILVASGGRPANVTGEDLLNALASDASAYEIHCPATINDVPIAMGAPPPQTFIDRLRVRGKPDDLARKITSTNIEQITAATASFRDDRQSGNESLSLKGTVGVSFDIGDPETNPGTIIPYWRIDRTDSSDPAKSVFEVNQLAIGVAYAQEHQFAAGSILTWQLRPEYVTDDSFDTSVFFAEARVGFIPGDLFCFSTRWEVGSFARLSCRVEGVADFGHAFDVTGQPVAQVPIFRDYARVGVDALLTLTGYEDTWLRFFTLSASYKNLSDLWGRNDDLSRFEGSFIYRPESGSTDPRTFRFEVGLKYVEGNADVTLQKQHFWELTFGGRF